MDQIPWFSRLQRNLQDFVVANVSPCSASRVLAREQRMAISIHCPEKYPNNASELCPDQAKLVSSSEIRAISRPSAQLRVGYSHCRYLAVDS